MDLESKVKFGSEYNDFLVKKAKELATPAGYPELLTARKFFPHCKHLLNHVEEKYGEVTHCWATVTPAGSPGIPSHAHNRRTVVYFPRDHSSSLWVEGVEFPTRAGTFAVMDQGAMHSVEPNDSKQDRISIVFVFDRKK